MLMITKTQKKTMLANGAATSASGEGNHVPVVKFFTPWAGATWLITDIDPEDDDLAFGLCDLGQGSPEMGAVRLSEIFALRGPAGLKVERDTFFDGEKPIMEYWKEARETGSINA